MQKLRACKGVYVSVCVHVCVCLCVTLWIDPLPVVITSFFFQAGIFNDEESACICNFLKLRYYVNI